MTESRIEKLIRIGQEMAAAVDEMRAEAVDLTPDLTAGLAIRQIEGEAAWWRSVGHDRSASRTFDSMTGDSQQAVRTGVERVLAHLQSTGRLIPAGGMALTAEQVEDVRTVLEYAGGMPHESRIRLRRAALRLVDAVGYPNAYLVQELREALAEVDGEFPATEPAAVRDGSDLVVVQRSRTAKAVQSWMTLDLWTDLGKNDKDFDAEYERQGFGDLWATLLGEVRVLVQATTPAPAEPAEEETKAERCPSEIEGWGCSLTSGHDGDHTAHDQDGPAYVWPASSPVVEVTQAESPWTVSTVEERQALPKGSVIRSLSTGLVEERWGDGSWRVSGHTAVLDGSQQSAFPCEVLYPRSRPVSSPVVPALTETEWVTWQEVPEGVKYSPKARPPAGSPLRLLAQPLWVNRGGTRYQARSGTVSKIGDVEMCHYAPFVAAEEG